MDTITNKDNLRIVRKGKWVIYDEYTGKIFARIMNIPSVQNWMAKHDIDTIKRGD